MRMKTFTNLWKSKKLFLAAALLCGGMTGAWADELTVYDGTSTNDYVPFYGYYGDYPQKCEFIIPSTDLTAMNGKSITGLTFYSSNVASQNWTGTFQIFLKEVTETTMTAFTGTTDATTVFEGTGLANDASKNLTITFQNNYTYGGGNLLIGFYQTVKGNYKSMKFYGVNQENITAWQGYSSSGLDAITGSGKYFIPKTTFTYETPTTGPGLAVFNGSTKLATGDTYDFGLSTAGTEKAFTLKNPGTESIELNIASTNGFGVSPTSITIESKGEATLTVIMADATASGTVTITPTTTDVDAFVINVKGTVKDANKMFEDFSGNALPDGWTSGGNRTWTYSNGYAASDGYSSSYYTILTTPKLTFTEGEQLFFDALMNSTYNTSTAGTTVQVSTDGTTFTDVLTVTATDLSRTDWRSFSVTIPSADVKYIRFDKCMYIAIDNVYGGEYPNEPNMKVTEPESLSFGVITENAKKTFTIANTGKATLEGINVNSTNSVFAISNAPATLAAGASQDVTITMAATTTGALSSDITVSATGMDNVTFTVTGTVLPEGLTVVDFEDNAVPANWTNASWSFANGIATGKSSSAYLTTPKLVVSDGDLIVLKARRADSDDSDYLTVQGSSDNGSTWTAYSKKLQSADGLTYPDFGTIVLTDIPATVNKLRFVGYYSEIGEIWGLNYAPVLTVTQNETAVTSPASFDFGECAADATVTYNFVNVGAGTINITNVAITGEGAAAYTTNWTESKAVPFDLVITRSYDAERTAAQVAVVTVTTTEGDFVINVSGTDKAANAPELAVDVTSLDFGKLTADDTKTVTVTNNGTGTLAVSIASDNEDFVVSPAELTEIGTAESKTFVVTFKFGTPYGAKTANITVTPTYNDEAAVTITATAKAKDPDAWSEEFTADGTPTGWDAGANWTIADGVAKASYAYGTTNYLTTPTLTVSNATDELTFDYSATANYVSIKIQMSKDGAAFADYHTISGLNNGDNGTYSITGLEAGNYQFRFANDDYTLDNFEGFKLNLADHIAAIESYTIPASSGYSMTMKEGKSFEATVTVKEMRGVEEALTAKLYMGTEVIGTATGIVAANSTETLTITATPSVAATDGAQMHIEVEWAGETLKTEEETRYVAAIARLTLDETSSDAVTAGTYDYVTLKRQFVAGWNTVCLPFTISDVEGFFGAGAKAYEFSSFADGSTLNFSSVNTLTASYPYIVYVATAITADIELTDITIASGDASAWYSRKTDSSSNAAYFRGTYAPVAAGTWDKYAETDVIYGVTSDGHIQKAGSNATVKGFRAYFDLPATADAARLAFTDESTGITTVIAAGELTDGKAFDLQGRNVQNLKKGGLYIINGKKQVVK